MTLGYSNQIWYGGMARGDRCSRHVRGTHGCGIWKILGQVQRVFFEQVVYVAGVGHCIRFW